MYFISFSYFRIILKILGIYSILLPWWEALSMLLYLKSQFVLFQFFSHLIKISLQNDLLLLFFSLLLSLSDPWFKERQYTKGKFQLQINIIFIYLMMKEIFWFKWAKKKLNVVYNRLFYLCSFAHSNKIENKIHIKISQST